MTTRLFTAVLAGAIVLAGESVRPAVDCAGAQSSAPCGARRPIEDASGSPARYARSAVGMNALPSNIAVEIEMIVEIED